MRIVSGNPVKAGVGLVVGIALVVIACISVNANFGLPANLNLGFPPGFDYTLQAAFADANGLAKGADVVEAGTPVGQVTNVQVSGRQAVATMRIDSRFAPVHRGAIARIRYSTLLAQKYVEISPAAGTAAIPSGGRIPSSSTITPVDFDQFLSTLDPQTRQQLQVLVQNAGGGVDGRQRAINQLLDNLGNLAVDSRGGLTTLHNHDSDLGNITTNLAITSNRLAQSRDNLGGFVQSTAIVNGTLAQNDQDLSGFIYHLANDMTDFNNTLDGEEGNFHTTVTTFDPFLVQLNGTLGTVYPYIHNNLPALQTGINTLIPEIGGAIAESDANGNYLRQYLVNDPCWDSVVPDKSKPPAGCGNQSAPAAPAGPTPPAALPTPRKTACPLPTAPPKPPALPTAVPTLAPCPTPLPPCFPVPGVPTPTPVPTASPGTCIPVQGNPLNPPGSIPVLPAPTPSLPGLLTGLAQGGL